MTAAAAFSDRPWVADATFDPIEDMLHSLASTGMGFAFALGVVTVMLGRLRSGPTRIAVDVTAIAAAALVPLAMSIWGSLDGALQRLMFLVAYGWYLREAGPQRSDRGQPQSPRSFAGGRPPRLLEPDAESTRRDQADADSRR